MYPLTHRQKKEKSMSEFNLVTVKLHPLYLNQTFLFFITNIASPLQKLLSHSQLKDKMIDSAEKLTGREFQRAIPQQKTLVAVLLGVNF